MKYQIFGAVYEDGKVNITWEQTQYALDYKAEYRIKGTQRWYNATTNAGVATLYNLKYGTEYEYRIGSRCALNDDYIYTSEKGILTPEYEEKGPNCGLMPDINLTNQIPTIELQSGMPVLVGDFPVFITEVTGSGRFSGKGYVGIPYLKGAQVAVKFDNIVVNTDNRLISGYFETVYDTKNNSLLLDVDQTLTGGSGVGDIRTDEEKAKYKVDFTINSNIKAKIIKGDNIDDNIKEGSDVKTQGGSNAKYTIVLVDANGKEHNVEVNEIPATIEDESGNSYIVEENGEISTISKVSDIKLDPKTKEKPRTDIAVIEFESTSNTKYAVDQYREVYSKVTEYFLKYKPSDDEMIASAKFMLPNSSDEIFVSVKEIKGNFNPQKVKFITSAGKEFVAEYSDKDKGWKFNILGSDANDGYSIYAVQQIDKNEYATLAKLNVYSYEPKTVKFKLVPVNGFTNGFTAEAVKTELNKIYGKVGIKYEVELAPSFDYEPLKDKALNVTGSGLLSVYTDDMKALNSAYTEANPDESVAALFIVEKSQGAETDSEISAANGFMPRGKQFGYMFAGASNTDVAHELGHGLFKLDHPFDRANASKSFAKDDLKDNLMQYFNGDNLVKLQWDAVHSPGVVMRIFEKDEDAMHKIKPGVGLGLTPEGKIIESYGAIKDKKILRCVNSFNSAIDYTIHSFNIYSNDSLETNYQWNTEKRSYYNSNGEKLPVTLKLKDSGSVYIYKLTGGQKCLVNYQEINWTYDNTFVNYVAPENWKLDVLYKHDVTCFQNLFSNVKVSYECFESEKIDNGRHLILSMLETDKVRTNIESDKVIANVNEVCLMSLKALNYYQKISLLDKVSEKDNIESQKAVLKLMSSLYKDDYKYFVKHLYADNNRLLNKYIDEFDDKVYLFFNAGNYTDFLNGFAIILNEESDEDKWKYINFLIKTDADCDLKDNEKIVITHLLSSLKEDPSNDVVRINLFTDMVKDVCLVSDFKAVYRIAGLRSKNQEIFRQFTQIKEDITYNYNIDLPASHQQGAVLYTVTTQLKVNNPSWILPGQVQVNKTATGNGPKLDSYILSSQKDLRFYYWSTDVLGKNEDLIKNLKSKNPELISSVLIRFETELIKYINEIYPSLQKDFWSSFTEINCDNVIDMLNRIALDESPNTLKNLNKELRLQIINEIIKCKEFERIWSENTDPLLKLLASFEATDVEIIDFIEKIGIDKFYSKFTTEEFGKFSIWLGSQVIQCGRAKFDVKEYMSDEGIISSNDVLQLEANIWDWRNFNGKIRQTDINVSGKNIPYDKIVPVLVADDFEFLGTTYTKGTVLNLPLIQAIAMSKANRKVVAVNSAWLAVDVISLAIGVGELAVVVKVGAKGVSVVRKVLILGDIVGSGMGAIAQSLNASSIKPETRFKLQMLGAIISVPNIVSSLPKGGKLADEVTDIAKEVKAANNADITKYFNGITSALKLNLSRVADKLNTLFANSYERIGTITKYFSKNKNVIAELDNTTEILTVRQSKKLTDNIGTYVGSVDDVKTSQSTTESFAIFRKTDGEMCLVSGACFAAETPVQTDFGLKNIAEIKVGDNVVTYDQAKDTSYLSKVARIMKLNTNKLVRLVTKTDTILSTPDHPYLTSDNRWINAGNISKNMKLKLATGLLATVISVTPIDTAATVYNFEVKNTHTYVVGSSQIITHNGCGELDDLFEAGDLNKFIEHFNKNDEIVKFLIDNKELVKNLKSKFASTDELARFVKDFKNADELKLLNENPDLIDVWKNIKYLKESAKDVEFLKWLDKFKQSNPQGQNLYNHIFVGEIKNNNINGVHHKMALTNKTSGFTQGDIRIKRGTSVNYDDFYTAEIEYFNGVDWITKTEGGIPVKNGFFPDNWIPDRVIEEIALARSKISMTNRILNTNSYRGKLSNGQDVIFYIGSPNYSGTNMPNYIISVFPVF